MNLSDALVAEFSQECSSTKKLLERLPEDKLPWKPHEKSMTLSRLATHLSEIPEWASTIMGSDVFDMGSVDYKPRELGSRQEILDTLQKNTSKFADALKGKADDVMLATWKLTDGDNVLVELPRMVAVRAFVLSHTIHHRGQLTVYLRLQDVPLPAIYGPSADESM